MRVCPAAWSPGKCGRGPQAKAGLGPVKTHWVYPLADLRRGDQGPCPRAEQVYKQGEGDKSRQQGMVF